MSRSRDRRRRHERRARALAASREVRTVRRGRWPFAHYEVTVDGRVIENVMPRAMSNAAAGRLGLLDRLGLARKRPRA